MATKQEKAVNRAFLRGKNKGKVREEKHALGLLSAAVLVLLYLLLAQHAGWWPYSSPKLGSAFYTNVSAQTPAPSSSSGSGSGSGSSSGQPATIGSSGSSTSTTSGSGSSGSGGSTDSSGSGGSGTTGSTPIADFAAGVNVGDTKAQTSAQANGLSQNCAVVVGASAPQAGQQQVCTYTEGNMIVTVTYLNSHVISASKSGF